MTVSLDMMRRLDSLALSAHSPEPDPNIKHFDHQLWRLIWKVGQHHADVAALSFSLSNQMIDYLCSRPEEDLKLLANGALLSFTSLAENEQVLAALNANIDPCVFLEDSTGHDADTAYWSLMARCGKDDPFKASQTFGVNYEIIVATARSTDAHLRHLAKAVQTGFKLRFDETLIPEIIENDTLTMAHVKRMVQCIGGGLQ